MKNKNYILIYYTIMKLYYFIYYIYLLIYFLQIEQEMSLIYDRPDVKIQFIKQWLKLVTGIITYGENSSKKCVSSLASDLSETGMQCFVLYYKLVHVIFNIESRNICLKD